MNSQEREPVSAAAATIPLTDRNEELSRLFGEHHRRVLIAAYRITGSMADAEDVAQSVFLRLGAGEGVAVTNAGSVGSSRVDLQACKLEYSIVSPK